MEPFRRQPADRRLGPSPFAEVYDRHAPGLLAFFARCTLDAEASLDLVGELLCSKRARGTMRLTYHLDNVTRQYIDVALPPNFTAPPPPPA